MQSICSSSKLLHSKSGFLNKKKKALEELTSLSFNLHLLDIYPCLLQAVMLVLFFVSDCRLCSVLFFFYFLKFQSVPTDLQHTQNYKRTYGPNTDTYFCTTLSLKELESTMWAYITEPDPELDMDSTFLFDCNPTSWVRTGLGQVPCSRMMHWQLHFCPF